MSNKSHPSHSTQVVSDVSIKLQQKIEDEATEWFVLLQSECVSESQKLSKSQKIAFQQWLKQSPQHSQAFEQTTQVYNSFNLVSDNQVDLSQAPSEFLNLLKNTSAHLKNKQQNNQPISGYWNNYRRWSVAAMLVIGIFSLVASYQFLGKNALTQQYVTEKGESQRFDLSDGSSVHMNTASQVNVGISEELRQVELVEGEVYFSVAHDKSRPFEVIAGDTKIRVLGTKFNVHYEGDKVEVSVSEGKVEVIENKSPLTKLLEGQESKQLVSEQKITHNIQRGLGAVQVADSQFETSWRSGELIFNDTPLFSVIREVNRYATDSQLKLMDNSLAQIKINAVFKQGDLKAVIDGLSVLLPIRTKKRTNGIVQIFHQVAEY
jgi:transmembrane sensor